jgi:lysophospholipid acyltransferase (LPLAT)-like uncharacterized protein
VPKPFSTVAVVLGEPLVVGGTSDDVIEEARRRLEERLKQNEARALELLR